LGLDGLDRPLELPLAPFDGCEPGHDLCLAQRQIELSLFDRRLEVRTQRGDSVRWDRSPQDD
jgi:hypothetical protein